LLRFCKIASAERKLSGKNAALFDPVAADLPARWSNNGDGQVLLGNRAWAPLQIVEPAL
jgi:hypothetical protein